MSPDCERPLLGRTVLVTRAEGQAGEFSALLEAQGARVVECPTIRLDPALSAEIDAAFEHLSGYDWLVLTSANAVRFFFARLQGLDLDAGALGRCRICAVGPKTAAALAAHGIDADMIPSDHKGEGVVAAFSEIDLKGARVLFPRADKAREVIPEGLTALGARVDAPVLYRNVVPEELPAAALEALEAGEVDCAVFTASSTAENLAAMLGPERFSTLLGGVVAAAIGPIAAGTCRRLGLEVAVEPEVYTLEALTDALANYFACRQR